METQIRIIRSETIGWEVVKDLRLYENPVFMAPGQPSKKGTNPDDSGADLVYFETDSKGAVFSVGSLCWNSSIAVDDGVSKVTKTVLERFLS